MASKGATAATAEAMAVTELWDGLLVGASLATFDGDAGYGDIADGALAWRNGNIVFAGPRAALPDEPARLADLVIEANGGWVTPGLVDCHTHTVFAGDRAGEFEQRLQGASYEEIARSGGGIVSTVRAPAPPTRMRCWRSRCRAAAPCSPTASPRWRSSPATGWRWSTNARCCAWRGA